MPPAKTFNCWVLSYQIELEQIKKKYNNISLFSLPHNRGLHVIVVVAFMSSFHHICLLKTPGPTQKARSLRSENLDISW